MASIAAEWANCVHEDEADARMILHAGHVLPNGYDCIVVTFHRYKCGYSCCRFSVQIKAKVLFGNKAK